MRTNRRSDTRKPPAWRHDDQLASARAAVAQGYPGSLVDATPPLRTSSGEQFLDAAQVYQDLTDPVLGQLWPAAAS
jgi:hypothetical protein